MSRGWDPNWARISRYCLLGVVVMVLWLLWPTVKCSWGAWNETPITETDLNAPRAGPGEVDNSRLHEGEGFFSKLGRSIQGCYAKTPLFGQEDWKTNLLFTFAGAAAVCFLVAKLQERNKRTFTRP